MTKADLQLRFYRLVNNNKPGYKPCIYDVVRLLGEVIEALPDDKAAEGGE